MSPELQQLRQQYPYYFNAIPASTLVEFVPTNGNNDILFIPAHTRLFTQTYSASPLHMQTLLETAVLPLTIHSADLTSIQLKSTTDHFEWHPNTPLRLGLIGPLKSTLTVLNQLHESSLVIKHDGMRRNISVTHPQSQGHPFQRLSLNLNRPELFTVVDLYIDASISISEKISIVFTPPLNPYPNTITWVLNCCPIINYIQTQSEPFNVTRDKTTYTISPEFLTQPLKLTPLAGMSDVSLSAYDAFIHHNTVLSVPIDCYQNALYQQCSADTYQFYEASHSDIQTVHALQPLLPVTLPPPINDTARLSVLLEYNYMYQYSNEDQTQLLKQMLFAYLHDTQSSFVLLITAIAGVTLNRVPQHTVAYRIQFNHYLDTIPHFIRLLKTLLQQHRPINTAVIVCYDIC
ncbi:MAG: hypothetical protein COB66_05975 [Coxiella sp. (in: Bacteria)]|nr:MAG: hypothetical protein COB66_05975 [Coxiella sp. (in: g-proteobacteria)]